VAKTVKKLMSGVIADKQVNVDNADAVGQTILHEYIKKIVAKTPGISLLPPHISIYIVHEHLEIGPYSKITDMPGLPVQSVF
jgi:hypothetical protein